MKYPKEYLEEIKIRLKVSQVVGKYVQLKKRGKEYIGLSPFKNEKTPSFTVNDEKGFYHCFSSGEHGNIFDFLIKTQSIGFGEAVKKLAAEAGLQPYRFSKIDEQKEKRSQSYKKICSSYSNFCKENLNSKANFKVQEYLKKRGLSLNTIEDFNLGYAPDRETSFKYLSEKFDESEILLSGIFYKHDKTQKYIDRFNSRIIFPINNLSGEPIAFGGRTIQNNKLAKYINSPETEFYKKGRVLFNLDKAKNFRSKAQDVIIVEGYMDVISLYNKDVKNVISNSGTALTELQINLIWNFFSEPIVCLDGDTSGQLAALRIAEKIFPLISEKKKIFFSILSKGQDPDDFIQKNGKEKFLNLLKQKQIIQDYLWKSYLNKIDYNNPYEISKFEKNMKRLGYTIKDETLRKYIIEEFGQKLNEFTPNTNLKKTFKSFKKDNFHILRETKKIFKQRENFSKEKLKEFSILFIMKNYPRVCEKRIEELSSIKLNDEDNEKFKNQIMDCVAKGEFENKSFEKIILENQNLVNEITDNSNIKMILKDKKDFDILQILDELIQEIKDMRQLQKIESFESELINNFDENSYSELIKLKSQLNRD